MGIFDTLGGFFGGAATGRALAHGNRMALDPWNQAMSWLYDQYQSTQEDYASNYQGTLDQFTDLFVAAKKQLKGFHAQEMRQVRMGTEASQAALAQGFEGIRRETSAMNIAKGLQNTSWGAASQDAVTAQESIESGLIEERKAVQVASTFARQGQEMAQMDQMRIGGETQLRSGFGAGRAGIQQNWARLIMGGEGAGMQTRQAQGIATAQQRQQQSDMGMSIFGNVLGAFGF